MATRTYEATLPGRTKKKTLKVNAGQVVKDQSPLELLAERRFKGIKDPGVGVRKPPAPNVTSPQPPEKPQKVETPNTGAFSGSTSTRIQELQNILAPRSTKSINEKNAAQRELDNIFKGVTPQVGKTVRSKTGLLIPNRPDFYDLSSQEILQGLYRGDIQIGGSDIYSFSQDENGGNMRDAIRRVQIALERYRETGNPEDLKQAQQIAGITDGSVPNFTPTEEQQKFQEEQDAYNAEREQARLQREQIGETTPGETPAVPTVGAPGAAQSPEGTPQTPTESINAPTQPQVAAGGTTGVSGTSGSSQVINYPPVTPNATATGAMDYQKYFEVMSDPNASVYDIFAENAKMLQQQLQAGGYSTKVIDQQLKSFEARRQRVTDMTNSYLGLLERRADKSTENLTKDRNRLLTKLDEEEKALRAEKSDTIRDLNRKRDNSLAMMKARMALTGISLNGSMGLNTISKSIVQWEDHISGVAGEYDDQIRANFDKATDILITYSDKIEEINNNLEDKVFGAIQAYNTSIDGIEDQEFLLSREKAEKSEKAFIDFQKEVKLLAEESRKQAIATEEAKFKDAQELAKAYGDATGIVYMANRETGEVEALVDPETGEVLQSWERTKYNNQYQLDIAKFGLDQEKFAFDQWAQKTEIGIRSALANNTINETQFNQYMKQLNEMRESKKFEQDTFKFHSEYGYKPTGELETLTIQGRRVTIDSGAADSLSIIDQEAAKRGFGGFRIGGEATSSTRNQADTIKAMAKRLGFSFNAANPNETAAQLRAAGHAIAPVGGSAHETGMAVDLFPDQAYIAKMKPIMEANGWKQTVPNGDAGHFEFVGGKTKPIFAPGDAAKTEIDLSTKFNTENKAYLDVRDSFNRVTVTVQVDEGKKTAIASAAGDVALIFNYMKMLDPGSTVREGEFATAQNSTGAAGQIETMYNRLIGGERLNPSQRYDFYNEARKLYAQKEKDYTASKERYKQTAESYGLDANNIIPILPGDYSPEFNGSTESDAKRYLAAAGELITPSNIKFLLSLVK